MVHSLTPCSAELAPPTVASEPPAQRERISPIDSLGHLGGLSVIEDGASVVDDVGRHERVQLLAEAIADLPTRCREVFIAYKIQGLSRREAAHHLGLSEKTVEAHTARAMRHCETFFQRPGRALLSINPADGAPIASTAPGAQRIAVPERAVRYFEPISFRFTAGTQF